MNKIVSKTDFSENVVRLELEAPLIAKARRAGHFVIVKVGEKGERIPLTIASSDNEKGTITLVIQKIGTSSSKLCNLNVGDYVTRRSRSIRKKQLISKTSERLFVLVAVLVLLHFYPLLKL